MGLKQNIKSIFIEKQHKYYETELSQKKMSYDDWIRKQEEKLKNDNIIVLSDKSCQKNEIFGNGNDSEKIKSAGTSVKNESSCKILQVCDRGKGETSKMNFLELPGTELSEESIDSLLDFFDREKPDVILLKQTKGKLSFFALPLLYQKFKENENIVLAYGDEDVEKEGLRNKPWFKPDWSPDTFLSGFYFGSLVAVRTGALKEALLCLKGKSTSCFLYELLKEVIRQAGGFSKHIKLLREEPVCHISEVLFHTGEEGYEVVKDWRVAEPGLEAEAERKKCSGNNTESGETTGESQSVTGNGNPLISVVIPSKDNPAVLFTCINSFIKKTKTEYPYEILVIDNGSNEENKAKIKELTDKLNAEAKNLDEANVGLKRILYHHEPMVFNFSRMCNKGVSLSEGELVLFLNDDMEIIQENWLSLLADKALLPYVGAVGAKLLYPDSDIIQHAGITNLRVGPAHKLQFLSDSENYYYGKNRGVHNALAATGACLMMRKEVFLQAGGFQEDLAVAFNDVDLCYSIYEAGYYNIVRNDVVLYHHESLSRGKDGESEEKQKRLLREKDVLYERHQEIYGQDPFYHKYLTTDMLESEYSPAVRYQVTLDMPWAEVKKEKKLPEGVREDGCVVIGMEAATDLYKWKYGVAPGKGKKDPLPEEMGYYFQGYSFIIGSDNACYKKTLLLENRENKQIIRIPLDIRYRPDIRKNLKDQVNVDLTGYAAKVRLSDIPEGEYRFGMLAEDKCSRLKLVNFSSWTLSVRK